MKIVKCLIIKSCQNVGQKYCANDGKIPLYAGSVVYVSKNDLMKIFIPNACIYTSRLSELVFGVETLEKVARSINKDRLKLLDADLLRSIITHVVQVFSMRGENINETVVTRYIQQKISNMSTELKCTDA
uniref:BEN domain-containing protein n=1 Tax=Glossina brevipalpis TaxID=37001 RepID=A0A1A9WMM9_9MUSC